MGAIIIVSNRRKFFRVLFRSRRGEIEFIWEFLEI